MRLHIIGTDLPGRVCGPHRDVHVGLQVGNVPTGLVPADAPIAQWHTVIDVVGEGADRDHRGPAVDGRRGARFLYLTWGEGSGAGFAMFRRAKLMLDDAPASAPDGDVTVRVRLTDDHGLPRCARVQPPQASWEVGPVRSG